jgi:thiamine-monophosphate kinase
MSLKPSSETDLIQSLFAPLARGHSGAFGLTDDVAYLAPSTLGQIVTQDQVIEGTHFLLSDPLDSVAKRLVRRNLSDLIAKGARPSAAFLSLAWPKSRSRDGIALFAAGLGQDLQDLCDNCPLMGGDTSTIEGPLVASLTMMGSPTATTGQPILRSGAKAGDILAVTGFIGDAWLGLQTRLGVLSTNGLEGCAAFAMAPYPPPLAFAPIVAAYANASLDVSDGLLGDGLQLARSSGLGITIDLATMPISQEALKWVARQASPAAAVLDLATGGDDYQCLMAITPDRFRALQAKARDLNVAVSAIGRFEAGQGLRVNHNGAPVDLPAQLGWSV